MAFKKGVVTNPKGNPNIIRDTLGKKCGPKTNLGKIRTMVYAGILKNAKKMKYKRRCNTCPLKPIVTNGVEMRQCAFYQLGGHCKLSVQDWDSNLRAFFMAQDLGTEQMLKVVSAKAYSNSLKAQSFEEMQEGRPGMWANEFLNTSTEALKEAGKIETENKKIHFGTSGDSSTVANMNVFDISGLIKDIQLKNVTPHEETITQPSNTTKKPEGQ